MRDLLIGVFLKGILPVAIPCVIVMSCQGDSYLHGQNSLESPVGLLCNWVIPIPLGYGAPGPHTPLRHGVLPLAMPSVIVLSCHRLVITFEGRNVVMNKVYGDA